ncbi:MAG: dehydrogenase [Phycisphaeraceae bacterium]|nr:MAG: dehydrogenase [Phycisphaeraceae bacterium]
MTQADTQGRDSMTDMTRRDVIRTGLALTAGAIVTPAFASRLSGSNDDRIRVGVIGCGGRGTGAAVNALEAHPSTTIVAMADLFQDRLDSSHRHLADEEEFRGRVDVPADRRFVGFDAYERLLALADVQYVVLATPPHFRPIHFDAAVRAGKHVFMEKPVATDPAGIRKVIAAAEEADARTLSVVAGTQRRHQDNYLELMERLENGAIGEPVSARCFWNQGGLWVHERTPEYSDMEWQCRNWLYFCWLSGDHICEQHVHNLDAVNWVMGGHPTKCVGMGGRQVRRDAKYGNIFDHFAIDYEYANGAHLTSMCRQTDGCQSHVAEHVQGTKGTSTSWHGYSKIEGATSWETHGSANPYVTEHAALVASIRGERPRLNEAKRVAESTLTAIMGRMSAYTGQEVTWEQAMGSVLDLSPTSYSFGPNPTGPVPTPGRTPLI